MWFTIIRKDNYKVLAENLSWTHQLDYPNFKYTRSHKEATLEIKNQMIVLGLKEDQFIKNPVPSYIRHSTILYSTFVNIMKELEESKKEVVNINGIDINMTSLRYQNMYKNGPVCKKCGIVGTFLWIEKLDRSHTKWHMNLYGNRENGTEVMLTKDHIIPKSKGGEDHIDNLQTLCFKCNVKKGSKLDKEVIINT